MQVFIVVEHNSDGCTYSGESNVAFYDSYKKASDHLYEMIDEDTFDYDIDANNNNLVTRVKPSEHDHQEFWIETVEVK